MYLGLFCFFGGEVDFVCLFCFVLKLLFGGIWGWGGWRLVGWFCKVGDEGMGFLLYMYTV